MCVTDEILGPEEDLTGVALEEDTAALDLELALNKARKLKQKKSAANPDRLADKLLARGPVAAEESSEEDEPQMKGGVNIMLNSTSEFCRTLGEIPTYGMAGNREEEEDELMVSTQGPMLATWLGILYCNNLSLFCELVSFYRLG